MYRVKYSKLSFIADTLSFVALFAAILLAVLTLSIKTPWHYAGIALATFVLLKLISRKIMAVREMLPAADDDFDPILTLPDRKSDPFDAALDDAELIAEDFSRPLQAQTPSPAPKTRPAQPLQQSAEAQQVPVLNDVVEPADHTEPTGHTETAAHTEAADLPATQFRCILVDDETRHQLSVTDFFDKHNDPENRYVSAKLDSQGLVLFGTDPLGEPMQLASLSRQDFSHIQCRTLRCVKLRRFKLFRFVAIGLLAGLLISLYLLWDIYFFHDAVIELSYLVTTILPVLSAATFAGLLVGILKPHKKIRHYTIYQVFSHQGCAFEFATRCRHARRVDKKLKTQGWTPLSES